jgi:hypothetical protein
MLPTVVTVSAGQVHGAQAAQVLPNTSGSGGVPYAVLLWLGALALPGVLLTARRAHTGARI